MRGQTFFQFLVCLDKSSMAGKGVVAPGVPSGKWLSAVPVSHYNFPNHIAGGEILFRLVSRQALIRIAVEQ